jgi:hypothetical protein
MKIFMILSALTVTARAFIRTARMPSRLLGPVRQLTDIIKPGRSFSQNYVKIPELFKILRAHSSDANYEAVTVHPGDLEQLRDLDVILTERAARFYDPNFVGVERERCLLISVHIKLESRKQMSRKHIEFSHLESLQELSELVGTAGLQVST